jgi:hypothetical protein
MADATTVPGDFNRRLLPDWADEYGQICSLPAAPAFKELAAASRAPAQEVWRAAYRLREIIRAWDHWWLELRSKGDVHRWR